ncbi:hypothetical protein GQ54DRAFT_149826 [Martensiomyces pterosporus]|nr:hypothetical protein GQ54DRAFT_149826 [Martensiomyces pterosporus]
MTPLSIQSSRQRAGSQASEGSARSFSTARESMGWGEGESAHSRGSSRMSIADLLVSSSGDQTEALPGEAGEDADRAMAAEALGSLRSAPIVPSKHAGTAEQYSHESAGREYPHNAHSSSPQFIQRVQTIPLVKKGVEMYDKSRQSSVLVRVGSNVLESGVRKMCEPITRRIDVEQLDSFACRQLDNLGYSGTSASDSYSLSHTTAAAAAAGSNNLRKRTKDQAERQDSDDGDGQDSISGRLLDAGTQSGDQCYTNGKGKSSEGKGAESSQLVDGQKQQQQQNGGGRRWLVGSLIASAKERAVAYREDSLRRLKYCLDWVAYATALLNQHIYDLRKFVESLQDAARIIITSGAAPEANTARDVAVSRGGGAQEEAVHMSPGAMYATQNVREAAVRLAKTRKEIVATVRKAVGVVSQYAGSVLPGEPGDQLGGVSQRRFDEQCAFALGVAQAGPCK